MYLVLSELSNRLNSHKVCSTCRSPSSVYQLPNTHVHGSRFRKIYGVRGINLSSSSIHRESADYDVKGFLPINCTLSLPDVIGEGTFHFFQIFGGGTSKIGGGGFLSDIPYYYIRKSIKYSLQMILEDKFILWNSLHKINQYL